MTDDKRKLLTKALGAEWHRILFYNGVTTPGECSCGYVCYSDLGLREHELTNRTFTTAQDWEDLRERVVRPNQRAFYFYFLDNCPYYRFGLEHFLTLSIEERNKLIHDFCIYMYKQGHAEFQWVKEFVGKEDEK